LHLAFGTRNYIDINKKGLMAPSWNTDQGV